MFYIIMNFAEWRKLSFGFYSGRGKLINCSSLYDNNVGGELAVERFQRSLAVTAVYFDYQGQVLFGHRL
jgi:hypothetical protein